MEQQVIYTSRIERRRAREAAEALLLQKLKTLSPEEPAIKHRAQDLRNRFALKEYSHELDLSSKVAQMLAEDHAETNELISVAPSAITTELPAIVTDTPTVVQVEKQDTDGQVEEQVVEASITQSDSAFAIEDDEVLPELLEVFVAPRLAAMLTDAEEIAAEHEVATLEEIIPQPEPKEELPAITVTPAKIKKQAAPAPAPEKKKGFFGKFRKN